MVLPLLIPLAIGLAGAGISYGANLYSQGVQRDLYRYQKQGYERALSDWNKNVGRPHGRQIRYPEQSFQGNIRSLDAGISQSYASSVASTGQMMRSAGMYGGLYQKSAGLYDSGNFRSHRWL